MNSERRASHLTSHPELMSVSPEKTCLHLLLFKDDSAHLFFTPLGQCSDWWTRIFTQSLRITVRTTILDYRRTLFCRSHITAELWSSSRSAYLLLINRLQEMEQFPMVASQSPDWISRLSLLVLNEEWEPAPLKILIVTQSSPVTPCLLNESIILSTDDLRAASTALLQYQLGERSAAWPASCYCPAAQLPSTPGPYCARSSWGCVDSIALPCPPCL